MNRDVLNWLEAINYNKRFFFLKSLVTSGDLETTVNTHINTVPADSALFLPLPFPLRKGFLTGRPVDVSAHGFLLQDHNRLCLVSNKDTFPGSLHVQWEAVDHVRDSVMEAAGRGESQEQENGCM